MAKTLLIRQCLFEWQTDPPSATMFGLLVDPIDGEQATVTERFTGAAVTSLAGTVAAAILAKAAQKWPTRTVEMFVPSPPVP